jgi:hypothetical protein
MCKHILLKNWFHWKLIWLYCWYRQVHKNSVDLSSSSVKWEDWTIWPLCDLQESTIIPIHNWRNIHHTLMEGIALGAGTFGARAHWTLIHWILLSSPLRCPPWFSLVATIMLTSESLCIPLGPRWAELFLGFPEQCLDKAETSGNTQQECHAPRINWLQAWVHYYFVIIYQGPTHSEFPSPSRGGNGLNTSYLKYPGRQTLQNPESEGMSLLKHFIQTPCLFSRW